MFFPDNFSKLFPCTSESLKGKFMIVWLPNNILCIHWPLSITDEDGSGQSQLYQK